MKKLTLDETWRLCLSMWRWIIKKLRINPELDIEELKDEWLEKHYPQIDLMSSCFFCEYDYQRRLKSKAKRFWDCPFCPMRIVDKSLKAFCCLNTDFWYEKKPIAFYNKLVSLNRKRLAKRKK